MVGWWLRGSPYGGGGTYGVPKRLGKPKKRCVFWWIFWEGINDCDYLIYVCLLDFFYFVLWYISIKPALFICFPTTWSESKLIGLIMRDFWVGLAPNALILLWSWNVGGEHQSLKPWEFFFRRKIQLWWSFFEKLYSSVHLMELGISLLERYVALYEGSKNPSH